MGKDIVCMHTTTEVGWYVNGWSEQINASQPYPQHNDEKVHKQSALALSVMGFIPWQRAV